MPAPPIQNANAPAAPAWLLAAGAALGAALGTIPPGLALLLSSLDHKSADLRALLPELVVAAVMGAFGAVQLRAQLLGRGRWAGALFVVANVLLVGVMGVMVVLQESTGSVDSGPAMIIGLFIVLGVMFGNALLAAFTWWMLAALGKRLAYDLTAEGPDRARVRAATWVLLAAAAHVVLKGVSGGPVVFGVVAAAVSLALLWPVRRASNVSGQLAAGLVVLTAGSGAAIAYRMHGMHQQSALDLPRCSYVSGGPGAEGDVLARTSRQVAGVEDAVSDVRSLPDGRMEVTLFVLPAAGAAMTPSLTAAVQRAIDPVKCTDAYDGARPVILVKPVQLVPVTIAAHVVAAPGADDARIQATMTKAVRDAFAVGGPARKFVHNRDWPSGTFTLPETRDDAILGSELRVLDPAFGDADLDGYVAGLPTGSIAVVEKVVVDHEASKALEIRVRTRPDAGPAPAPP